MLLPVTPKRRVCTDLRQFRDFMAFPENPAFCERSMPPPRDSRRACPCFWRQSSLDQGRARETTRKNSAAPLVVRDRQYPFNEDLIPDASGNIDPQLPMLNKVSSLVDALQHAESLELVQWGWELFVLTASRMNITVAWSRDEVLVGSVSSRHFWLYCLNTNHVFCFFLVHHPEWDVSANSETCRWLCEGTQTVEDWVWRSALFHLYFCESIEEWWVHPGGSRRQWSQICWTT